MGARFGRYALAEPSEAFDDRPGARRQNGVALRRKRIRRIRPLALRCADLAAEPAIGERTDAEVGERAGPEQPRQTEEPVSEKSQGQEDEEG